MHEGSPPQGWLPFTRRLGGVFVRDVSLRASGHVSGELRGEISTPKIWQWVETWSWKFLSGGHCDGDDFMSTWWWCRWSRVRNRGAVALAGEEVDKSNRCVDVDIGRPR